MAAEAVPAPVEVVVIGSGTVALQADRVCAGYYVQAGANRLLFDCGPGTPHQLARFGLPWDSLTHVAISHFHTDHVAGLPLLLFAMRYGLPNRRTAPLALAGPPGTVQLRERLADAFGDFMRDPGFEIETREMDDGDDLSLDSTTRLRAHRTRHTESSIAYRLETLGGSIGYTGDTGMSESLGEFFSDVDLLIAECSLPDEQGIDSHMTPSRVAMLARLARPGRLLVTHVYPQLERLDLASLIRDGGWDGPVMLARDGMRLQVDRL